MTDQKSRRLPVKKIPATTYPMVVELPADIYEGIGKIVSAHAILETQVWETLFDISKLEYPIGRVLTRYQAAGERFKTIRRLLDLHGITPSMNTNQLFDQIADCCDARDQFAHGVWTRVPPNNKLALRLTRGDYETPDGKADRSFIPEATFLPDGYFDQMRRTILGTIEVVMKLKEEINAAIKS